MPVVPILLYHRIDTTRNAKYSRWAVSPERFDRHMRLISEQKYRPITIGELSKAISRKTELPQRTVVITFDDGLRDFLAGAIPILLRYGFPATLFVVAGRVGGTSSWMKGLGEGDRPILSWRELRFVAGSGIEIGGHSCTHPQLDIMPQHAAYDEIRSSKLILEDQLSMAVESFAYPHGYASRITRELVRRAGYSSACRVRNAFCATDEDIFGLSRIIITEDMDDNQFTGILRGEGLPISPPADRPVAQLWRMARQMSGLGRPQDLQSHA